MFLLIKGIEFLVGFILLGIDICILQINTDVLDFLVHRILKYWSEFKYCSC